LFIFIAVKIFFHINLHTVLTKKWPPKHFAATNARLHRVKYFAQITKASLCSVVVTKGRVEWNSDFTSLWTAAVEVVHRQLPVTLVLPSPPPLLPPWQATRRRWRLRYSRSSFPFTAAQRCSIEASVF